MKNKIKRYIAGGLLLLFGILAVLTVPFGIGATTTDAAADLYDSKTGVTLKDTDGDGRYEIKNADELDAFSSLVNDSANAAICAELTADILYNAGDLSTLNGAADGYRAWQPIGLTTAENGQKTVQVYKGTFDGGDHTIYGLYYRDNWSYAANAGLFAALGNGAAVKNVSIAKSYFAASTYIGALAGEIRHSSAVVENCHNVGSYVGAYGYAGGLVGDAANGTIRSCSNSGKVEFIKVNEELSGNYECLGGITGKVKNTGKVVSCINTGDILSTQATNLGGIAGCAIDGGTVESCLNLGRVAGTNNASGVGGIVSDAYNANVRGCLNLGNVEGFQRVGNVYGGVSTPNDYSNNYYLNDIQIGYTGAAPADQGKSNLTTKAALESGELAYRLGAAWGQDLDNGNTVQKNPVPGGARVYYGYAACNATEKSYTNKEAGDSYPDHAWEYRASGGTLTAECEVCEEEQSVTLQAPVTRTYDGTVGEVTAVGSIEQVTLPELVYTGDRKSAGTHTASLTLEGVTASVSFVIEKATVTVRAENKTMEQYTALPTLTYTAEGFIGEDGFTVPPVGRTETDGRSAGSFAITFAGGENGNYDVQYLPATLTVTAHAEHVYDGETDADCNLCGETRTPAGGNSTEGGDRSGEANSGETIIDDGGVEAGPNGFVIAAIVIAVIAIGAVVLLGGGFAVYWFVIRKKSE